MAENILETVNNSLKVLGLSVFRVAVFLMLAAQLWLSTHYVTRAEHEALKADVAEIKITLRLIAAQSSQLQDHESRIRYLERGSSQK